MITIIVSILLAAFSALSLFINHYAIHYKREYEKQKAISTTDNMTGMKNQAGWQELLQSKLDSFRLNHRPFFIAYYDLDNFKFVNDTYGHTEGDKVLTLAAQAWKTLAYQQSFKVTFSRKGGDEFAAVLETSSEEDVNKFCKESLQAIKPDSPDSPLRFVTASCGYAEINEDIPPKAAEDRADYALYKAKTSGKNQVAKLDASLEREIVRTNSLNNKVIHMLDTQNQDRHLMFNFQKIIKLKEDSIVGYEVLSTYSDEDGESCISDILEAAERVGKSVDFDFMILDKVLLRAKDLADRSEISVNFSSRTIGSADFIPRFECAIKQHPDFPIEKLMLDLKEVSYVKNREKIKQALQFVRSLGCKVSIDDFGTGCSSYAYLIDLESVVDRVKIDKDFIQKIDTRPSVISGILAMCKELQLETVAEGIETPEQLKWLIDNGVKYGQGYAIGVPRTLESLMEAYSV